MKIHIRHAVAATLLAIVAPAGCKKADVPPPAPNVIIISTGSLPDQPSSATWDSAPEYVAELIPQDLVDPRLMESSTPELRVRALTDGSRVAFRLQWADETQDDVATSASFSDACAVQLPVRFESTLPAPQMGEPDRAVEITYWNAAWQAGAEGRVDSITDLYPNATVDHYPFEAPSLQPGSSEQQEMAVRYAPARALGNFRAAAREVPVEDMTARGPGTLTRTPAAGSHGFGSHTDHGWAVVITRRFPSGFESQPFGQVAFAVWEGSRQEVGARKMRTGWITLAREEKP